jgi:GR25 family glycosyltransferase involved in LPS biosynthesis
MKSFIIHLSKIPASVNSALQLQQDLKSIDIDAELFEGTYGSDAKEIFRKEGRTIHPTSFKGGAIDERYTHKSNRPGVMGCFYSHYRLWQKCVDLNTAICIFEDDVNIFRPLNFVEFEDVLILALGAVKRRKYIHFLKDPQGIPKAEEYENSSMPGAVGYMITPAGAKKLLKCYKQTFLPSDNAINTSVVDIKILSHLIGEANIEKKSLTKASSFWDSFNL